MDDTTLDTTDDIESTMLTTIDNPFSPFDQFNEWNAFDIEKGYYTCAYIARITVASDELGELDQLLAIDKAINEIVNFNILGLYIKVNRNYFINKSKTQ